MPTPLDAFSDLMTLEGPSLLGKDVRDIINYVQAKTYTPARLIAGRAPTEMITAGDRLQENIYLESVDLGEWYNPTDYERDEINPQTAATITSEWRYFMTSLRWNLQEVMHNVKTQITNGVATHQFGDLLFKKKQNLFQTLADAQETQYWRTPVASDMEGSSAIYPYSIPTFICEETNSNGVGVPLTNTATTTGWTNMCGLDITDSANTRFDNARLTYSSSGGTDAEGGDLIGTLKRMARELHYVALPNKPEYGIGATQPECCMASSLGLTWIEGSLRGQDRWGNRETGTGGIMLGGVAYEYIESVGTAAVYKNTSSDGLTTEEDARNGGPRFYFVSQKGLCPKFYDGMFLSADEPMKVARRPLERVQHYHLWGQLWPTYRRGLGIVSPSTDLI